MSMLAKLPFAQKINAALSSKTTDCDHEHTTSKDSNNVENFYDDLASDYHLIFNDWNATVKRQGDVLDTIIKQNQILKQDQSKTTILDCACGIGTQAIGLALMGYKVYATDLSINSVKRAKHEAHHTFKLSSKQIQFSVANFCNLDKLTQQQFDNFDNGNTNSNDADDDNMIGNTVNITQNIENIENIENTESKKQSEQNDQSTIKDNNSDAATKDNLNEKPLMFDIIIACDNALPHLLYNNDIMKALTSMKRKLNKNGMILISTRDYDQVLDSKPLKSGDLPRKYLRTMKNNLKLQQIVFQTWDWSKCGQYYRVNHYIMIEKKESILSKQVDKENDEIETKINYKDNGNNSKIEFNAPDASLVKEWDVRHRQTVYYAIRKNILLDLMKKTGFKSSICLHPSKTGLYYQPIFIAWKKE